MRSSLAIAAVERAVRREMRRVVMERREKTEGVEGVRRA